VNRSKFHLGTLLKSDLRVPRTLQLSRIQSVLEEILTRKSREITSRILRTLDLEALIQLVREYKTIVCADDAVEVMGFRAKILEVIALYCC
jgi:uncharacterized tellurite resistance protein B-like protein